MDGIFILHFRNRQLPVVPVIKRDHADIVILRQFIHRMIGSRDRKIQIRCPGIRIFFHGHTAGMVDDHHHRKRRHLIRAARHHINRQDRLQCRISVQSEPEALLAAGCDQPAAVIFDIRIQIPDKSLRQIIVMYIFENHTLVLKQSFECRRCTTGRNDRIVTARTVKKRRKIR